MAEEIDITNVYSEEVNDIVGREPPWILYRGNTVISVVIFFLFIGGWFLKYPDIISAPVLISSYDPPVKLIAQSSGRILHFYADDGDLVEANKVIAVLDNPSNTNDMLYLKTIAEEIDTTLDIKKTLTMIKLPVNIQVGEIQPDYSSLYEAINNYNFFLNNTYYSNKLKVIGNQEENNNKIEKTIKDREKILDDQLKVEQWKDSINRVLLQEKIISLSEYNQIKKGYLSQNLNGDDNLNSLLQNQQQQKELQKSASDIKQEFLTNQKDVVLSIKSTIKRIKGQIGIWEKQYVLKTPISGRLIFFRIRKVNQYVNYGTPVFMIVPPTAQQYEVRALLPLYKAGKVKIGQQVLIKLQEYPYEEYGMLRARIVQITNVSIDSVYSVELKLENGMYTTRNRKIDFRPEISGTADIITNNKNILQRIFEGVYGKFNDR